MATGESAWEIFKEVTTPVSDARPLRCTIPVRYRSCAQPGDPGGEVRITQAGAGRGKASVGRRPQQRDSRRQQTQVTGGVGGCRQACSSNFFLSRDSHIHEVGTAQQLPVVSLLCVIAAAASLERGETGCGELRCNSQPQSEAHPRDGDRLRWCPFGLFKRHIRILCDVLLKVLRRPRGIDSGIKNPRSFSGKSALHGLLGMIASRAWLPMCRGLRRVHIALLDDNYLLQLLRNDSEDHRAERFSKLKQYISVLLKNRVRG